MSEVTVVIPTIGRPQFLRTALQSVRNQIGRDLIAEVVVSENMGNRSTEEVVREFPELPIRFLFREPTLPMFDHLCSTFRQARTSYVAILNDDDWWAASHLANGILELKSNPAAAAYATASLFVVDEAHTNPRWIERSPALWLFAGMPSWLTGWTLERRDLLALCWVYTPFHISSMIARTDHLFPVLDELVDYKSHTHTLDRLVFAGMALRGAFAYNPVPETFVRWHSSNWIKTQDAKAIEHVVRSTVQAVEQMAAKVDWDLPELWRDRLSAMPAEVEGDVVQSLRQGGLRERDLERHGLAQFFQSPPPNYRLLALRGIAANTKKLLLGRA